MSSKAIYCRQAWRHAWYWFQGSKRKIDNIVIRLLGNFIFLPNMWWMGHLTSAHVYLLALAVVILNIWFASGIRWFWTSEVHQSLWGQPKDRWPTHLFAHIKLTKTFQIQTKPKTINELLKGLDFPLFCIQYRVVQALNTSISYCIRKWHHCCPSFPCRQFQSNLIWKNNKWH